MEPAAKRQKLLQECLGSGQPIELAYSSTFKSSCNTADAYVLLEVPAALSEAFGQDLALDKSVLLYDSLQ